MPGGGVRPSQARATPLRYSCPCSTTTSRFTGLTGTGGMFIPLVVQGAVTGQAIGVLVGSPNPSLYPVLGIAAVTSLEVERIVVMRPGDTLPIAGYTLRFDGIAPYRGPNFTEEQGHFTYLDKAGRERGLAQIEAEQARGSHFASHSLSFGARLARNDIHTRFDGEGCETLFNGLYHVDGRRHVDHHTLIEHAMPLGTSREYYRGLVDGNARGVFAGRIIVAQDAQRSDAMQRCDNLLLSRLAEADARPELEIYADDVKCAHGATVGQLDEDSLFYLRARGLDEAHARQLLTYAFAAEALARIGLEPLRARARGALLARLPGGELLEALA